MPVYFLIIMLSAVFVPHVFAGGDIFTVMLRRGSRGEDVRMLQEFLRRDTAVYPEKLITGYFGVLTEAAVKRFQKQYGIPQTGIVGPGTRKKINELLRTVFSPPALPVVREMRREVSAPKPLRASKPDAVPAETLTSSGVFEKTNQERARNNARPLQENDSLGAAARAKIDDMFGRQYFAHESPSGARAGDLAKNAGYEYINIGENLALGDFENDAALVQAWMNSPGHRANILGQRFTEIGIAARQGIFEDKKTWLAVQIFGRSIFACPAPDAAARATIGEKQKRIDDMSVLARIKKEELDAIPQSEVERYNDKTKDYNAAVVELNWLIEETGALVEKYNNRITAFNACVAAPAL